MKWRAKGLRRAGAAAREGCAAGRVARTTRPPHANGELVVGLGEFLRGGVTCNRHAGRSGWGRAPSKGAAGRWARETATQGGGGVDRIKGTRPAEGEDEVHKRVGMHAQGEEEPREGGTFKGGRVSYRGGWGVHERCAGQTAGGAGGGGKGRRRAPLGLQRGSRQVCACVTPDANWPRAPPERGGEQECCA